MGSFSDVLAAPTRAEDIQRERNPALRLFRKPCDHELCRMAGDDCGQGDVVLLDGSRRTYYEDIKGYRMFNAAEEQRWFKQTYPDVLKQQQVRALLITGLRQVTALRPDKIRFDDDPSTYSDDELLTIFNGLKDSETILQVHSRRIEAVEKAAAEGRLVAPPERKKLTDIETGDGAIIEAQARAAHAKAS